MSDQRQAPISVDEMAHAFEEEVGSVDLTPYAVEDWVTLAIFWAMAVCVFLQFFTRYALNNSLAWTEEIAANCLVMVVFLGSAMCVRMARHIQVDLLYRFLSPRVGRGLTRLVDLIVIGFFAYACWLMWRYVAIVGKERMVTVDLPRGIVFYTVLVAFVLMLLRAIQASIRRYRHKASVEQDAVDNSGYGG